MTVTRTTKHFYQKDTNIGKINDVMLLLVEYRRVAKLILDDIWDHGYEFENENKTKVFSVKHDQLELPLYIDYKKFNLETTLSARVLSSLVTQLSGIIRAATEKRRRMLYVRNKKLSQRKYSKYLKKLLKTKAKTAVKPNLNNLNMELSSKNADIQKGKNEFDYFLRLKSLGICEEICIPIRLHQVDHKFIQDDFLLMNSFLIGENSLNIRYNKKTEVKPVGEIILGADQGQRKVLQLSDGQKTPRKDKHGHTYKSIMAKLSKSKKGSNNFKQTQSQRTNFVNWSINKLNIKAIKEFRLEDIWNIRYKRSCGRKQSHWAHAAIEKKVISVCEIAEVPFILQSCTYRSQRCSRCGLVLKKNRKSGSKEFICKGCGYRCDADYNASKNHSVDLFILPSFFRQLRLNRTGFYWGPEGVYDLAHKEYDIVVLRSQYLESLKQLC